MYIQCESCKTCTELVLDDMHRVATCVACGRNYSLFQAAQLGSTPEERYRQASEYAASHGTDLASAYSILLGITSLENAPSTREDAPDPPAPTEEESHPASEPASPDLPHHKYDPGFRDAVAEGHLTLWQAAERGDRVLYATRLAEKHGLPMSLAFLVADNRVTLMEARNRVTWIGPARSAPERDGSVLGGLRTVAIVLPLLAVLAFTMWEGMPAGRSGRPEGAEEGGRRRVAPPFVEVSFEIRTNASDQPTEVRGHDPQTVLRAFCESSTRTAQREPVRVVPSKDDWIGTFRENGALWAIRIRRDPEAGDWGCGNAKEPIVATKASDLLADGNEAR